MSQSKPHFHPDKLKQRKTQRKKNKEARAAAKKAKHDTRNAAREERRQKAIKNIGKPDAALNKHFDSRTAAASKKYQDSKKKMKQRMIAHHNGTGPPISRHQRRKEMLAAVAANINAKAQIAEDRLLMKTDKMVDTITAYVDTKLKDSGLPMIFGIEAITLMMTGIIDIIPIPEVAVIGEAIEGASDALVSGITSIGPNSLTDMIESQIMPVMVKFANIFQGIAASFSCCPQQNRAPSIKMPAKQDLKGEFKKLTAILKEVEKAVEKKKPANKEKLMSELKGAQKSIQDALIVLNKDQGGGSRRRKTRRKRRHKIRRKKRRRRYSKRRY